MNHKLSVVAYDGYSYWWVCTCGAHGPAEDSRVSAWGGHAQHAKRRRAA